jgi:hypothetical protein
MFTRISNGWELAKESWSVLKLDKELMLFPLFSGISCLAILVTFLGPLLLNMDKLEGWMEGNDPVLQTLFWVGLFLFYFCNYFVIVFFNSALVACAIIRFRGGDPTVMDGIQASLSRLPQILAWALVSATVGIVLKAIESRSEKLGEFVAGLLGGAWTIMTYFVVPVLVVEKANPVDAVKRSFQVMTRAWGESLTAGFSIGLIAFLFSLLAMLPLGAGGMAFNGGDPGWGPDWSGNLLAVAGQSGQLDAGFDPVGCAVPVRR